MHRIRNDSELVILAHSLAPTKGSLLALIRDLEDMSGADARRTRRRILKVGVSLAALSSVFLLSPPAQPMNVPPGGAGSGPPWPNLRIYYYIDPSIFNAGITQSDVWTAEQAWKIQGLAQQAEFWNDQGQTIDTSWPTSLWRYLVQEYIDGPGGDPARASYACRDNESDYCKMRFEFEYHPWLYDRANFRAEATHEFGHWLGTSHSQDFLFTDDGSYPSRVPTMYSLLTRERR